jgi:aspartate/methionine/tyrosine aminotransferase
VEGEIDMADITGMKKNDLERLHDELMQQYQAFKSRNLSLDMTRGKPCGEQLDLAAEMMTCVNGRNYRAQDGTDCRNYGGLDGLPEAKILFSEYLEVAPDEIIISGNSSLSVMHDTLVRAMLHGTGNGETPWGKLPKIRFLCPSPGYDRHFFICEYLNIEMIPVELGSDGPDMKTVESLAAADESIKGIWCVPKYSNPTGITYSGEVVDRLASMKTKAADFRIFWDNAYTAHHLTGTPDRLKNILESAKKAGHPERVLIFGSTSKVSLAGSGLSFLGGSPKNIEYTRKQLSVQTIGPDKLNQLRHLYFFKDMNGITEHMKKHAAIIKPKFDIVQRILSSRLADKHIAQWTRPNGGYFVSIDTLDGCAAAVIRMAREAGVKLTPAGATFPHGKDPRDRNIRIAPTFPPADQVETAMELVAICIQLESVDKLLRTR